MAKTNNNTDSKNQAAPTASIRVGQKVVLASAKNQVKQGKTPKEGDKYAVIHTRKNTVEGFLSDKGLADWNRKWSDARKANFQIKLISEIATS